MRRYASENSVIVSLSHLIRFILGPLALKKHGIGLRKTLTSYPSVKDKLLSEGNYSYEECKVVVDGKLHILVIITLSWLISLLNGRISNSLDKVFRISDKEVRPFKG